MQREELFSYFSREIEQALNNIEDLSKLQEIRLRANKPVMITYDGKNKYLSVSNGISDNALNSILIYTHQLTKTFELMCDNSLYFYQNQVANGFLTLYNGCRVGICGSALYSNGKISNITDISSLTIRIAKQVKGAADKLYKEVVTDNTITSLLLVSPPAFGKTTMLRDLARQLSQSMFKVSVIDHKYEIAAMKEGKAGFDLGTNTDVLSGFEKADGVMSAIMNLSPQVIICDEITSDREAESMLTACNCGVAVIASCHGRSYEEISRRPVISKLLVNTFSKVAIMNEKIGLISQIIGGANG